MIEKGGLESFHAVAARAILGELAPMRILPVAIITFIKGNTLELLGLVAVLATDFPMHAEQRIACAVVIEGADAPALGVVATLAVGA